MNNKLIAIGEALIDFIPNKTGCDFSDVTSFSPNIGGAPANVCAAFTILGGKASLITKLGDDPFGHKIANELSEYGIDTSQITFTDKANTALAFVSLGADGNRTFSFYRKPSADMLLTEDEIDEKWFENCYVLHFGSVSLGDFPMKDAHLKAIECARENNSLISFDPNLRFMLWDDKEKLKTRVNEFIPMADILKISDEELEFITGEKDPDTGIKKIFDKGVPLVVYTCGSNGAYVYTKNGIKLYTPGKKVHAVDTTGAGDGFIGAFLWRLHSIYPTFKSELYYDKDALGKCLGFANQFCSISVQYEGAIASYPKLSENYFD